MGKGGTGGTGGGLSGSIPRSRFFRALGLGGPSSHTNEMLKQVAVARGLDSVDELLVCLGKQDTGISSGEAMTLMVQELGGAAVLDNMLADHYSGTSGRENCERLLKIYVKEVEKFGEDHVIPESSVARLRKYCGYPVKEET